MVKPLRQRKEAILQRQSFGPEEPGPILRNIQAMIEAIAQGIPTTSKYSALPISCLSDLNETLSSPIVHKLKRPQLKSFPTLAGLFLLLRASGLAVGKFKTSHQDKRVVMIDPAMLESWASLNPTEKYMSLVDVWLTQIDWSILGESDPSGNKLQQDTRRLYHDLHDQVTYVDEDRFNPLYSYETRTAAALLEQFGWIKLKYAAEVAEGKVAAVRSIEKLDFSDAMFSILSDGFKSRFRNKSFVKKSLKPWFPLWKQSLRTSEPSFREGRYTLKLSWSSVWRRLVAPATTSLDTVVDCLLQSFDFDEEHLYQFEYRDRCGRATVVADPRLSDEQRFADEVRLGDLPLDEGDCFELQYDFGDNWKFTLLIEKIEDLEIEDFEPKITSKRGKSPEQYNFENW